MTARKRKPPRKSTAKSAGKRSGGPPGGDSVRPVGLRIIGGKFRGRKLLYGGRRRVRPMKHRLREAIFNLIGPSIRGKHAVDLFAGTGALGLEALSRGAARATLIEQHFPTAAIIRQNVAILGVEDAIELVTASVFVWQQRGGRVGPLPWVVFCSPPYDFYVDRTEQMLRLVGGLMESAPDESIFAVESDRRFDFTTLPASDAWDVRTYAPAEVGVYRKAAD